ncbi:aminotransferase class IV [Oricola indica]|uniref:aminotransferase class IV n=1 Tax=Oricola indica TaxID=2872591 RepID=UPI003CCC052D
MIGQVSVMPQCDAIEGFAYVDGTYSHLSEAHVHMLDRGFVRSDATYDVVHLWGGRFFRLDDHLERFYRSMRGLRLQIEQQPEELKAIICETTRRSGLTDAYVQMTCTRGVPPAGTRDPRLCRSRLSVFSQPFVWISSLEQQEAGLRLVVADTMRIPSQSVDQRIKNFHWLDLTMGIFEAQDKGADIAVHLGLDGKLTEGAGFNIFALDGNQLFTPATGIFEGVTRRTVIELAPSFQLNLNIGAIGTEVLEKAQEIFVTSTAGGIMPVTEFEGRPVGNGGPGPKTLALRKAYWELHTDPRLTTGLEEY